MPPMGRILSLSALLHVSAATPFLTAPLGLPAAEAHGEEPVGPNVELANRTHPGRGLEFAAVPERMTYSGGVSSTVSCRNEPASMNAGRPGGAPKGCAGAVWWGSGSPSKSYCAGGNGRFPWWAQCCVWDDGDGDVRRAKCAKPRAKFAKPPCDNTCNWDNDGDCDDGGPGSEYFLCDRGTDCNDCKEPVCDTYVNPGDTSWRGTKMVPATQGSSAGTNLRGGYTACTTSEAPFSTGEKFNGMPYDKSVTNGIGPTDRSPSAALAAAMASGHSAADAQAWLAAGGGIRESTFKCQVHEGKCCLFVEYLDDNGGPYSLEVQTPLNRYCKSYD